MNTIKRSIAIFMVFLLFTSPVAALTADGSMIVIITKTGECYHYDGCRTLRSRIEVTLQDAVARGYRPCQVCNPPTLSSSVDRSAPVSQPAPSDPEPVLLWQDPEPVESASPFTDLSPSEYYYNAVIDLSDRGVIGGFPDGSFKPNQTVTRAQLAVMLVNANKLSTFASAGSTFTDVSQSYWAYPFISTAANAGYLGGYPDGSFQPEKEVSYNEALTMVVASLGYKMSDLQGTYPTCFTDKAKEIGVMNTCSKTGTGLVTRAEISCFLSDSFSSPRR